MEALLGVCFLVVGLPSLVWPAQIAKLGEVRDAIGSRRSLRHVEPAAWNVGVTRAVGLLATVFGVALLATVLSG